jgi:hypothetical protein
VLFISYALTSIPTLLHSFIYLLLYYPVLLITYHIHYYSILISSITLLFHYASILILSISYIFLLFYSHTILHFSHTSSTKLSFILQNLISITIVYLLIYISHYSILYIFLIFIPLTSIFTILSKLSHYHTFTLIILSHYSI